MKRLTKTGKQFLFKNTDKGLKINSFWKNNLNIYRLFKKNKTGQASLEFALVIPILILVIFIVSQLGYLVYLQNVLEQAAREGARILSTTNSDSRANNQIERICPNLDKDKLNIEISPPESNQREVGDIVAVTITYDYGGISNFIRFLMQKDIYLRRSSSMRMECY